VQSENIGDLIVCCVRGDDRAQAFFYTEYVEVIRRTVVRKLQSLSIGPPLLSEVEDICNDIFTRIFADNCRVLSSVRTPGSIRAWLVTLARHNTVDYVRKWAGRGRLSAVEVREEHEVYGSDCGQQAMTGERDEVLSRCLSALSDEERLILNLFFMHGRKYVEIAEMTGRNVNTVSAKLRRAKAKLRRLLEEEHYENPY
jgi:RNA polymerase sigma factor (sigma-70 family)